MSPQLRRTWTICALAVTLLAAGCAGTPSNEPTIAPPPTEPATTPAPSADDPRYPDPGEEQATTDDHYLEALRREIPWTGEIGREILIYAGRANCVVQVDTGSHSQALQDADERGFHGQDGPVFVQLSAQTYCPSMRTLGEPEPTPEPAPAATPDVDPADMVPEFSGEVVGFQDGSWKVDFTFVEVPGATAYELQHRGTGDDTEWASDVFDAPSEPEDSLQSAGTVEGLEMVHDASTISADHRLRAYFGDNTVGRWSNVVTARNPHL